MSCVSPPVRQVVVGVGHVDEPLYEVGALYEAEEHLEANRRRNQIRQSWRRSPLLRQPAWGNTYLGQPRDVQALPVLHRRLAGLARPRPLALTVGETGPGEDVVVGQVQVCRVHCKLADELQQAGQAVEQPLRRRTT